MLLDKIWVKYQSGIYSVERQGPDSNNQYQALTQSPLIWRMRSMDKTKEIIAIANSKYKRLGKLRTWTIQSEDGI